MSEVSENVVVAAPVEKVKRVMSEATKQKLRDAANARKTSGATPKTGKTGATQGARSLDSLVAELILRHGRDAVAASFTKLVTKLTEFAK